MSAGQVAPCSAQVRRRSSRTASASSGPPSSARRLPSGPISARASSSAARAVAAWAARCAARIPVELGALLHATPPGHGLVVDGEGDPVGAQPVGDRHREVTGDDRVADAQLPDRPQHDLALGLQPGHPLLDQGAHPELDEVEHLGVGQHGGDPVAFEPGGEDRRAAVDLGEQQAVADGDGNLVAHRRRALGVAVQEQGGHAVHDTGPVSGGTATPGPRCRRGSGPSRS